jgi:hypothetical protein
MTDYSAKKSPISDADFLVTEELRAEAFWLLCRYSSLTYIGRMYQLYAEFLRGYENFARTTSDRNSWYRENLADLYKYQALFESGLDLLGRGHKTGYEKIKAGLFFGDYLLSRRFEYGLENEPIGYKTPPAPHERLYAWAHVAIMMSVGVERTLKAEWTYPRIAELPRAKAPFQPLPRPTSTEIDTGAEVVASGIWQPIGLVNAAPNYLVAGRRCPPALRLATRIDFPAFPGDQWDTPTPARTTYEYAEQVTRWALLWEDHRYEGGKIPDESAYLDASTAPPPWPPAA